MSECIEHQGFKTPLGYRKSGRDYAHRIAYRKAKGEIPPGMYVMHSCDNPACINPEHLSVGTSKDNFNDMRRKGREKHALGEKHGLHKLTESEVKEIKAALADGTRKATLARAYGVTHATIRRIERRNETRLNAVRFKEYLIYQQIPEIAWLNL